MGNSPAWTYAPAASDIRRTLRRGERWKRRSSGEHARPYTGGQCAGIAKMIPGQRHTGALANALSL